MHLTTVDESLQNVLLDVVIRVDDPAPSAGLTTPAHQWLKRARIFRDAGTVVRDGRTLDMNIANKTILVTGANRGIGRALLEEALRRGARKVYAGTRGVLQHSDKRVTPLTLDVTSASQVQEAVKEVEMLDVL